MSKWQNQPLRHYFLIRVKVFHQLFSLFEIKDVSLHPLSASFSGFFDECRAKQDARPMSGNATSYA